MFHCCCGVVWVVCSSEHSMYYIQRVLCYNLEKFVSARPCISSGMSRLALSQLKVAAEARWIQAIERLIEQPIRLCPAFATLLGAALTCQPTPLV